MKAFRKLFSAAAAAAIAFAAAALISVPAAAAAELKGVEFRDTAQVDGNALVLNGLGLRQATALKVNVYVAGLYLVKKESDPRAILESNSPKRLVLHFLRGLDSEELTGAWDEGFEKNAKAEMPVLKERIEKIKSFTTDMKAGQRLAFTCRPGQGVETDIDGVIIGTVGGDDFARAFLSIWLGDNPPNKILKEGLLGNR